MTNCSDWCAMSERVAFSGVTESRKCTASALPAMGSFECRAGECSNMRRPLKLARSAGWFTTHVQHIGCPSRRHRLVDQLFLASVVNVDPAVAIWAFDQRPGSGAIDGSFNRQSGGLPKCALAASR